MNFAADIVDAADARALALIELTQAGDRREWSFHQFRTLETRMSRELISRGTRPGDVVMTLIGNRPAWVATMVACFRIGAVVLPCTEQLRAKDLGLRIDVAKPRLIVADERNRAELEATGTGTEIVWVDEAGDIDWTAAPSAEPPAATVLAPTDPCLITFTSGTAGEPKAVLHAQRYLLGQRLQASQWLGARAGDLVWCTAASGWSKSARNVFIAPWLNGATALLHDARFDPRERLELIEREQVDVLCMAPTEYRVIAKRATLRSMPSLRELVAAGEALNPEVLSVWQEATARQIRDGYGQTETGQMTANVVGEPARAGSMGRPLKGTRLWIDDGELVADPATVPTFFLRYLGEPDHDPATAWRTGDRVTQDPDGYLWFEGRADDVIISAGYRIGPFEVESALVSHEAVAEAAVVAAPDDERGSIVRAVVVLRDGHQPSAELIQALQDHVKAQTAPYKYPRLIDFAEALPKTASGKVRRANLRA